MEINDLPSPKQLLIPTPITAQATYKEARMLVGGGVAIAADVYRAVFRILEGCGNDPNELASEFTSVYLEIEQTYTWKDDERLQQWTKNGFGEALATPKGYCGQRGGDEAAWTTCILRSGSPLDGTGLRFSPPTL